MSYEEQNLKVNKELLSPILGMSFRNQYLRKIFFLVPTPLYEL